MAQRFMGKNKTGVNQFKNFHKVMVNPLVS